ncbi:MAG: cell division protein FtsZ [Bacteroidaceae bacterium]|nr:cell division protein FtsZ [Bacteroidaceae bacterium]
MDEDNNIINSSEINVNNMLQFDSPLNQSSYIKVIGVGGGGGNAVNNMYRKGIEGVDFIISNTDAKALKASPVPNKVVLGDLGAGNDPEVARQAAEDHKQEISECLLHNTKMLFITAGMGGGTGTGAAPVIAKIAKEIKLDDSVVEEILVVAVVTTPFEFEGESRKAQALEGIEKLRKHVDSILIIDNDRLREMGNMKMSMAFAKADDVLFDAVKGISDIITKSKYVSVDFRDVNTVMKQSGTALMGTGIGKGENRAMEAIMAASTSELLSDNDIRGAKNVLLYFSFHPDNEILMDEIKEATEYLTQKIGGRKANIIWGTGEDENLGDELKITLIATGFESINAGAKPIEGGIKTVTPIDPPKPPQQPGNKPTIGDSGDGYEPWKVVTKPRDTEQHPENATEQKVPQASSTGVRNVMSLYEDTPKKHEEPVKAQEVNDPFAGMVVHKSPIQDNTVKPVEMVTEAPAPAAQVAEAPKEESMATMLQAAPVQEVCAAHTADLSDINSTMSREERVRIMNDILHNNPNGAEMVEALGRDRRIEMVQAQQRTADAPETSKATVTADGYMSKLNTFLFCMPD